MKFYDQVSITIESGRGGDGVVSGRREKYEARGGPAGGDGGRGGSVLFRASDHEYTLLPYRYNRVFKASSGMPGQSKQKHGQAGEDRVLLVPVGTLIKDAETERLLAHLTEHGEERCGAKGGRGGVGNMHFVSSSNQYPQIALQGEPGELRELQLELQLLGDVALVGTPSVGKSTLINAISNVKAATAAYHFTTIVPNLGMVNHKGKDFSVVDIPGLIEGAAAGKGLGNEFLRHILKARIFTFLLDGEKYDAGIGELTQLIDEIASYIDHKYRLEEGSISQELFVDQGGWWRRVTTQRDGRSVTLLQKALLIMVNKYDTIDDAELRDSYTDQLVTTLAGYIDSKGWSMPSREQLGRHLFAVSALTKQGVDQWLDKLIELIDHPDLTVQQIMQPQAIEDQVASSIRDVTKEVLPFLLEQGYLPEREQSSRRVRELVEPEVAYLTYVLPRGNDEAELWYRKILEKQGHLRWLAKAGANHGDVLKIVSPYTGQDDRYLIWE